MAYKNDFSKKVAQLKRDLPTAITKVPGIVLVEGLKFIDTNFKKQGFQTGTSTRKWDKRKKKDKGKQRSILVKSSDLRRSFESESDAQATRTVFESNLPYTEVHNDGGRAGRGKGFDMPQRQMIGDSAKLDAQVKTKIDKLMNKIL